MRRQHCLHFVNRNCKIIINIVPNLGANGPFGAGHIVFKDKTKFTQLERELWINDLKVGEKRGNKLNMKDDSRGLHTS